MPWKDKSGAELVTVAGLVVGAAGIGVLKLAGVEFPVAVPPGLVILLVGAVLVALLRWRWAPLIGVALGLFVIVGFLVSPDGLDNLRGEHGAGPSIGSCIQLAGVAVALLAGAVATRDNYRRASSRA
jgi:hypothetical protein